MKDSLSPLLLKKFPISIRRSRKVENNNCEFTIKMSWELAEQLQLIAAPFLRELCLAVEQQAEKQRENDIQLTSMQDHIRKLRYVALHMLKLERVNRADLYDIAEEMVLYHDCDPRQLFSVASMLKRERHQRVERFRNRQLIRLYHQGWKKSQLARQFQMSVWVVNKIIAADTPRIA